MIEIFGITQLERDLTKAAVSALPEMRKVTATSAKSLQAKWRANARATAGAHGRYYPSSITSEEVLAFGNAVYDVGPEAGRKQGGMGRGFEYGSRNQPPHLDGKRAADVVEPQFSAAVQAALAKLF